MTEIIIKLSDIEDDELKEELRRRDRDICFNLNDYDDDDIEYEVEKRGLEYCFETHISDFETSELVEELANRDDIGCMPLYDLYRSFVADKEEVFIKNLKVYFEKNLNILVR